MAACADASRVVAVGTTAVRALESAAATGGLSGRTDLYIHGAYPFAVVDVLVTNFHLPRSSLLLLVEAFCGPVWRQLYATAIGEGTASSPSATPWWWAGARRRSLTAVPVRVEITAQRRRRAGRLVHTARGSYPIPAFMPVGTRGAVKALDSPDLEALGAEVVLANTYHLMLRPGADVVAALGGLHRFTGWSGHTLTDSGGYQVHSLGPVVDDDGVTFASVYDGTRRPAHSGIGGRGPGTDRRRHPDGAGRMRHIARTARGAAAGGRPHRGVGRPGPERHRRLEARPEGQALFGIVQGGTDPELRTESAERTVALDFDGYGIGGLSVGEPRPAMLEALAATVPRLPADRPRYLMGVGDPVALIEAVALGVDQFDCVAPTRMARHGSMLTTAGRLNLRNASFARDDQPLDPLCTCTTCARWSRGYLRHLLLVGEPTAWRLLTIHNLAFTLGLMAEARLAIGQGRLDKLRARTAEVWGA